MATARPVPDPSLTGFPVGEKLDGFLLRRLAQRMGSAPLRYALGRSTVATPDGPPVATLRFRDRRAVLGLVLDPEVHFGDAYADGRIEIEGSRSPGSARGDGTRCPARAPTCTATTTSATPSTRSGSTSSSSTPAR